jgi:hypothetical protein
MTKATVSAAFLAKVWTSYKLQSLDNLVE